MQCTPRERESTANVELILVLYVVRGVHVVVAVDSVRVFLLVFLSNKKIEEKRIEPNKGKHNKQQNDEAGSGRSATY
jgi:hypothetical protein